MSQALYDSLLEKWQDFLSGKMYIAYTDFMPEIEVQDTYDDMAEDFCEEYKYSEKTKKLAFFGQWWDTFKDEFYQKLDKEGVKIIHENPMKGDWDFGKKFEFIKGQWKEVEAEKR